MLLVTEAIQKNTYINSLKNMCFNVSKNVKLCFKAYTVGTCCSNVDTHKSCSYRGFSKLIIKNDLKHLRIIILNLL